MFAQRDVGGDGALARIYYPGRSHSHGAFRRCRREGRMAGNDAKEAARKVVLEKAKLWATTKKPGACSEYDFVLDIPNVASIQYGWPLNFASPTVYTLLTKSRWQATKRPSIVALLGYYSKGKSFVLNQLYNAGKQIPASGPTVLAGAG
jgi:hypothetical protein